MYQNHCAKTFVNLCSRCSSFGKAISPATSNGFSRLLRPTLAIALVSTAVIGCTPAHAQTDSLYVSNPYGGSVTSFDSSGAGTPFVTGVFGNALGVAISGGNLYVADQGQGYIDKYNGNGVGSIFYDTLPNTPIALAADNAGNIYATTYSGVLKINSSGVASQFNVSGDLSGAFGMAYYDGNVYVSNANYNTIEEFNSAGVGHQFNVSGDLNAPIGLAFDSSGNLYVANVGDNTIEEFNSSGVGTQFNVSGDLNSPQGLAFDNAGNLFVGNSGDGTIEEFNSSGVGTQFNTTPNPGSVAFLAFGELTSSNVASTPEPGLLGLFSSLSLAGIGFIVRHKRKLQAV